MKIEYIAIVLLTLALALAPALYALTIKTAVLADTTRALESVKESASHYNALFKDEERAHAKTCDRLAETERQRDSRLTAFSESAEIFRLKQEIEYLRNPRSARITLADAMPPAEIGQHLAGTSATGPVRAIVAHISTKMVLQLDAATDRPAANFTKAQRLHEAGGAAILASLLRELQELTAAQDAEKAA